LDFIPRWWTPSVHVRTKAPDNHVDPPELGTRYESDYNDAEDPKYGFGLTEFQVYRLQKILTRMRGQEVSLSEAWGRACEMLAMAHAMMAVLVNTLS